MKLTWKNAKPTVVLGSICLIVALALALVNALTVGIIADNAAAAQQKMLAEVIPGGEFEEVTLSGDTPATVQKVFRETKSGSYVVVLSTTSKYTASGSTLDATVAVSAEGKIVNTVFNNKGESKDFADYPTRFTGKGKSDIVKEEDDLKNKKIASADVYYSGVTYSSTAFREMMKDALTVLQNNGLIGGVE